jgi:hypothetical protein
LPKAPDLLALSSSVCPAHKGFPFFPFLKEKNYEMLQSASNGFEKTTHEHAWIPFYLTF